MIFFSSIFEFLSLLFFVLQQQLGAYFIAENAQLKRHRTAKTLGFRSVSSKHKNRSFHFVILLREIWKKRRREKQKQKKKKWIGTREWRSRKRRLRLTRMRFALRLKEEWETTLLTPPLCFRSPHFCSFFF